MTNRITTSQEDRNSSQLPYRIEVLPEGQVKNFSQSIAESARNGANSDTKKTIVERYAMDLPAKIFRNVLDFERSLQILGHTFASNEDRTVHLNQASFIDPERSSRIKVYVHDVFALGKNSIYSGDMPLIIDNVGLCEGMDINGKGEIVTLMKNADGLLYVRKGKLELDKRELQNVTTVAVLNKALKINDPEDKVRITEEGNVIVFGKKDQDSNVFAMFLNGEIVQWIRPGIQEIQALDIQGETVFLCYCDSIGKTHSIKISLESRNERVQEGSNLWSAENSSLWYYESDKQIQNTQETILNLLQVNRLLQTEQAKLIQELSVARMESRATKSRMDGERTKWKEEREELLARLNNALLLNRDLAEQNMKLIQANLGEPGQNLERGHLGEPGQQ